MNMKKLFSLALLVSAFSVVPAFAVEGDDAVQPEAPQVEQLQPEAPQVEQPQPEAPQGSWCPFAKLVDYPIFNEVYGLKKPGTAVSNYITFLKDLVVTTPVKTAITFVLAMSLYNNIDNIKSAFGLAEEQEEADAQVFADAKCGCTDEQAEEDAVVEVCVLEEEETKKANA